MRALVYTRERRLDVLEISEPALAPGEALVKVERAGICGSDVHGVATNSPRRTPPLVMGHELIGEVVAASDAKSPYLGLRVAVNPQVPCGVCTNCRSGRENICQQRELVGGSRPGGFGELVAVPERCLHVVSPELAADIAVLGEPVATCIHALRLAPLAFPETVVVLGAGTIGALVCVVARLSGAGRIVVSEPSPERRAWASGVADEVCHPDELEDALARVRGGATLAVDAVGAASTQAASVRLLAPGGCAIWLGMHDLEASIPSFDVVAREQSIRGSFAYTNADFARALELLAHQPERFAIPSTSCSLEDGARAFAKLVSGSTDGILKISLAPHLDSR